MRSDSRRLCPEDVENLCSRLRERQYGSFEDEQIQNLRSRLVVCFNDRTGHQFCIRLRNDDGTDGVEHRSIRKLVKQLQAEAEVEAGQNMLATSPPR